MTRRREMTGVWCDRVTQNYYNLNTFCLNWGIEFDGQYDLPALKPCDVIPDNLFPYDERDKWKSGGGAIHFFCEDKEFESVWLRANRFPHMPAIVKHSGCALTPDFSIYTDFPIATQIWNVYRSRLMGAIWHRQGIDVIPSASWGVPSTFEWCFDGLPIGGTIAVSTVHVRCADERQFFLLGFVELLARCKPDTVLCYGRGIKGILEQLHPNLRRYDSRLTQIANQRRKEIEKSEELKPK